MSGEPAPGFWRKQDWYRLKVLVGACPTEELAYTTQYNSFFKALHRAGISVGVNYSYHEEEGGAGSRAPRRAGSTGKSKSTACR
jgi:hypothetical protein